MTRHGRVAPTPSLPGRGQQARRRGKSEAGERGAALLEFALILPILLMLLAFMFDIGVGFGAGRSSAEAARSAARTASQDPTARDADFRALSVIQLAFAEPNDTVDWVAIYRTTPAQGSTVPAACTPGGSGASGVCNVYTGADIDALAKSQFAAPDCAGSLDALWCPTERDDNDGEYLGVAIWSSHRRWIGLIDRDPLALQDQSVFPIFVGGETVE